VKKAVLAYLIIIGLVSVPVYYFFQKIRIANENYRGKTAELVSYDDKNGNCAGELFYKTGTPIQTIYAAMGQLYVSGVSKKLTVVNLADSSKALQFDGDVYSSFYSYGGSLYASDYFNDRIVQILLSKDGEFSTKKTEAKVGLPSALVIDGGHYFVSNYASGNITKVIGRDGFLFKTNFDQITGMEIKDRSIFLVRTKSLPSLVSLNLDNGEKKIIDDEKDFSAIASVSGELYAGFRDNNKTKIGRVVDSEIINEKSLDCSFPVKIAGWNDKIYYASTIDKEGKIFILSSHPERSTP